MIKSFLEDLVLSAWFILTFLFAGVLFLAILVLNVVMVRAIISITCEPHLTLPNWTWWTLAILGSSGITKILSKAYNKLDYNSLIYDEFSLAWREVVGSIPRARPGVIVMLDHNQRRATVIVLKYITRLLITSMGMYFLVPLSVLILIWQFLA